jgi:D-glycero-D-manno-heptose 1,7-bisphosphate phosphatase
MSAQGDGRRAVFIDRDGTLIEEVNFLSKIEHLRVFPFTGKALRLLKSAGFLVIIVTNQSGIGRKIFDETDMHAIHDELNSLLPNAIDAFYFCPHLPGQGCRCRKPNLGMIEAAQGAFDIDLDRSWMIGDKRLDVETGLNAGMRTAIVLTGYGGQHSRDLAMKPDLISENLLAAAEKIVELD